MSNKKSSQSKQFSWGGQGGLSFRQGEGPLLSVLFHFLNHHSIFHSVLVPILLLVKSLVFSASVPPNKFMYEEQFLQISFSSLTSRSSHHTEPWLHPHSPATTAASPDLCHRAPCCRTSGPQEEQKSIRKVITEWKLLFKHMPDRQLTLTGMGGQCSAGCCHARHERALKEYKICSPPCLK